MNEIMTPSSDLETIRCLLCQGVICFTQDDDARYKDHLYIEHRVFYYVSWIIEKTVEENRKEDEHQHQQQSISLPSITITPLANNKPVTKDLKHQLLKSNVNGLCSLEKLRRQRQLEEEKALDEAEMAAVIRERMDNGDRGEDEVEERQQRDVDETAEREKAVSPLPAAQHHPPPPKLKKFPSSVFSQDLIPPEEEDEEPNVSVIPVHQDVDFMEHHPRPPPHLLEGGPESSDYNEYVDYEGVDEEYATNTPELVSGVKEARIITIRVEGQRVGGRKMYKCSLCPNIKPWPTIHKAERHRITHIPLAFRKMFQCPQCKERFIKEKNVKRHLDSGLCQGPRDHPCVVCNEVFESKFDLQLHEENHVELLKRHKCHLCGAKFNKMKYLNKHIFSHSNHKPYKCDICGKSFKSEYYVKTHRAAHQAASPGHNSLRSAGNAIHMDEDHIDIEDHLEPEVEMITESPSDEESKPKTDNMTHIVC